MFPKFCPQSRVHEVYRKLYNHINYKKLAEENPHRFKLEQIGDICSSFASVAEKEELTFGAHESWYKIFFVHDQLKYCARTKTQKFTDDDGKKKQEVIIKLPNNGFMYKPVEEFKTKQTNLNWHSCSSYALLSPEESNDPFLKIWLFITDLFGDRDWTVMVLYSYEEERIDLKFSHEIRPQQIELTFEPGYPVESFSDVWKPNF